MLQKLPLTQISQSDTLNYRMHQLQIKVDSLNKIVEITTIKHGFFSDALSFQLTAFSAIIGLAALVSWGWIKVSLMQHQKKVSIEAKLNLSDFKNELNSEIVLIWDKLNRSHFDVNRLGYNTNKSSDAGTQFLWVMATLGALQEYRPDMVEDLLYWAKRAQELIKTVNPKDIDFSRSGSRLEHYLKVISVIDNTEIQTIIDEIIKKINHLKYNLQDENESPTDF